MKRFYLSILMAGLVVLTSCSEDVYDSVSTDYGTPECISINVSDGVTTRTAYSGLEASFESGDAVGIYAVTSSGEVIADNIQCTYNGTKWVLASDIPYFANYKYYAYAPYVASPYTPNFSDRVVNNIFSSFLTDASDIFHLLDQSIKTNYQASDLMIAEGTPGENCTVNFAMDHKKGLVVFEGEDVGTHTFTTNIPYTMGNKKYYLVKPSTLTTVGGYDLTVPSGQCIRQEVANYSDKYMTFTALANTVFTLNIPSGLTLTSVSYSIDNGSTWTTTSYSGNSVTITTPIITAGNKVLWKGIGTNYATGSSSYSYFSSLANFVVSGNIMSMLRGDDFVSDNNINNYVFNSLFKECSKIVSANNLKLPATTLAPYCYQGMFYGCTSLTAAPELPATTLANYCYQSMFNGCTSLTTAPKLPATTLALYCYQNMFSGCTSLTTAPELPTTTLPPYCYQGMFYGCTSLTTAPELPATTLANYCYQSMFNGCTSLTTAPELPATTLANYCYHGMFNNCTALTAAPELPATTLADYCYQNMFIGCISLTTAPELPATTLARYCYQSMFSDCISLTTAPKLPATTLANYCYQGMFSGCISLTTAPELPTTTLADYCYHGMFNGCTSLTAAPELPATTLAGGCYQNMFIGCISLTTAPELPATTLASSCYRYMFQNCTSLTTAPELPATTLANYCYQYMFSGCISLTTAPELPATTLANYCYQYMFQNCTSLTTAPELPAATLVSNCYSNMFNGCKNLNYIKAAFKTTPSTSYTNNWVSGVASSGTFYKNSTATWTTTGVNGVPSGWTVQTYTP